MQSREDDDLEIKKHFLQQISRSDGSYKFILYISFMKDQKSSDSYFHDETRN